ncbi:MAG: hypothetical protein HJJLKODD_01841 [Phycisphaerae bacterium]|nr:hypothetical protein [Phycisphaerae bacterium]
MPWPMFDMYISLPVFFLVLGRITGLMITAPLYGSLLIPTQLKALLALAISVLVFPLVQPVMPVTVSWPMVLSGMVGELLIGLVLGMGLNTVLLATQMGGMIIGQQAGLSLAEAYDPNTEVQSSVIGEIYFWTATVMFLMLGGHRLLMKALLDTFATLPPMQFQMEPEVMSLMAELMMNSLVFAVRLAGPAILALLIAKSTMGFLSRTMPQLHILSVGFAIFVGGAMVICGWQMDLLDDLLVQYSQEAFDLVRAVLRLNG